MNADNDIVEDIGNTLAVLASRWAQERYMVGATRDGYLLLDEAVEDGLCVVDMLPRMDTAIKAHVLEFLMVLRAESRSLFALSKMTLDESFLENPSLAATRAAARLCLEQIGFDLAKWEREF